MANKKISELPAITTPTTADLVPVVQSGTTDQITRGNFLKNVDADATLTDITTNDASTSKHGYVIKATAPSAGIRNVVAIDNGETTYKNTALFDNTNPAALGSASPGTSLIAARRDHVHDSPATPDASAVTYTPSTLADWDSSADPGATDDALDQLASRVADIEAGGGGGGSITVEELDGAPSVNPVDTVKFDQGDGFTVTDNSDGSVTIGMTGGGGGGGTVNYMRIAKICYGMGAATHSSGNYTLGQCFFVNQDCTLDAVEFAWDGVANKTIKISLWDAGTDRAGTTLLDSGTVAVTSAGLYTYTPGSPISLTSGRWYFLGSWETSGTYFLQGNYTIWDVRDLGKRAYGPLWLHSAACANGGGDSICNADLNSSGGVNVAPLNPILS